MTEKTEDEIAREKEAVQKMVGAKTAMEAALSRLDRLNTVMGRIDSILADAQRSVGEGLYVKTHYHGTNNQGELTVKLKDQLGYARQIIQQVK